MDIETVAAHIEARLSAAGREACRLLHGRGRCFPGFEQLAVDYFHPILLVTLFEQQQRSLLDELLPRLQELASAAGLTGILLQQRFGEELPLTLLWGEQPHTLQAQERGLAYGLRLDGRQNLGFFLDMAVARGWLADRAVDKRVLNLFAYTCAFSVVARGAGARQVVNLDMSSAALRQGQQNHQRNRIYDGVQFLGHDLFKSWGKLRRLGPFDLLVVDPPSRQHGSFVAERDYRRVLVKLPELCAEDAELLLCLNSPHLGTRFLQDLVSEHAPGLQFQERLANPPEFADIDPESSLKVLSYRYRGG